MHSSFRVPEPLSSTFLAASTASTVPQSQYRSKRVASLGVLDSSTSLARGWLKRLHAAAFQVVGPSLKQNPKPKTLNPKPKPSPVQWLSQVVHAVPGAQGAHGWSLRSSVFEGEWALGKAWMMRPLAACVHVFNSSVHLVQR